MKVIQVNCVYNKGSTGKIMCDIHSHLIARGIDSVICYGRGEKTTDDNVYKTCGEYYSKLNNLFSRFTGLVYGGCFLSTNKLISVIKREKPDVVHIHCINGYFVNIYRFIEWLKGSGIPTVLTLHAEFMHTANCTYAFECDKWKTGCGNCSRNKNVTKSVLFDNTDLSWKKMKAAFDGFEKITVISVSPWLMNRAKQSPILQGLEHRTILNGLDTSIFTTKEGNIYKEKHGITDERVVFHATSQFDNNPEGIKGGYYLLQLAEQMKDENIKFFVAGKRVREFDLPDNVIFLGSLSNQEELAKYYYGADLTVLASKKETFSMVVAESLCCGTPVAGFYAGAPEQITIPEYSRFSEYGNIDVLKDNVLDLLNCGFDKDKISKAARDKYEKEKMIAEYMRIYSEMKEERD